MDNKQNNNPLLDRIMRDIEDVTPTPKWQFLAKKWLLLSACVGSVLLGALTVTGIIFSVVNVGFAYYRLTHKTLFGFILDAAPFLWITSTVLLIASAYATFRTTEGGYKYPLLSVIGGVSAGSILLGFIFFSVGMGQVLEEGTRKFAPFTSPLERIEGRWNTPEQGRLAGLVFDIHENMFDLEDIEGKHWNIQSTELKETDFKLLRVDERVRIIGVYKNNEFIACVLLPWDIRGGKPMPPREAKELPERKLKGARTNTCEDIQSHTSLPPRIK